MSESEVQSCINNQFYKIDDINYINLSNIKTSLFILCGGIGFALLILIIETTLDCHGFKSVFEEPKHKKYFKQTIVK
jgi:Trk-type K+ transport system membrane component